ncbi:MAG: hypothetical protein WBO95_08580 [Candidatus Dechloromonas phosphoritropha]
MTEHPNQPAFLVASDDQNQTVVALPITPLFTIGEVVSTPGALEAMQAANVSPLALLHRHLRGDWGNLDKHDKQLNDLAIKDGSRIFSAYKITATIKVWLITEADRSATTFLLPSEY